MQTKQQRKCIACKEIKHQTDMLRVAKINNNFLLDNSFKLGGRGAYICKDNKCISLAIKKRMLNRGFKMNIDSSIYEVLGEYEQNN